MATQETFRMRSFRVLTGAFLISWLILPLVPLAIGSFAKGWFYPDLLPRNWSLRAWEYRPDELAAFVPPAPNCLMVAALIAPRSFSLVMFGYQTTGWSIPMATMQDCSLWNVSFRAFDTEVPAWVLYKITRCSG